jgi:hypothetical protein
MIKRRKEGTVETSRALRILVATAAVSALVILMTSPAQAYYVNEGGDVSVTAPVVGNPGDGAQVPTPVVGNVGDGAQVATAQVDNATVASSGSDGFDGGTIAVIAGGVVLALGAAALLFTARHRRVALP